MKKLFTLLILFAVSTVFCKELIWEGEKIIDRTMDIAKQDLTVIIEVKHPAIPAHRTYKMDPYYTILNIERNCMKLEYAGEMQNLLDKIRMQNFQNK